MVVFEITRGVFQNHGHLSNGPIRAGFGLCRLGSSGPSNTPYTWYTISSRQKASSQVEKRVELALFYLIILTSTSPKSKP